MLNPGPALLRGRAAAESLMVDTCVIRRIAGTSTDDNTGIETPTYATVYTGRCRVQQRTASASAADVGEAALLMVHVELQLPMSVTGVLTGDKVTITASVYDPDLIGQVYLVKDLFAKTHATARRLGVERRTS
jgi:uncharacterized protein DUF6093